MTEQSIKLVLNDKKAAYLATVLQLLKATSEVVAFSLNPQFVHIQVMDKTHVCLCDCRFYYDWFLNADELATHPAKEGVYYLSTPILHTVVNSVNSAEQKLIMEFTPGSDELTIDVIYNVTNKENINKHYTLKLISAIYEFMNITEFDYVAEFTIGAKTIQDIFTQMFLFGSRLCFTCTEDGVCIASSTDNQKGKVDVTVSCNDFEEFAIDEGANLNVEFSCAHILKYCITTKLVPHVKVFIGDNTPMKICYSLADENDERELEEKTIVRFYISPAISDDIEE